MNYFGEKSFFIWMFNEALSGLKTGKYTVDENGVLLEDTHLNVIRFDLTDENNENKVVYLVTSYAENMGMTEPKLSLSDKLLGPGTDDLVENLYQELQKRFKEDKIKDKWGDFYHNSLKNYIKNKKRN